MKAKYKVGQVICFKTGDGTADIRKIRAVKVGMFSTTYAVDGFFSTNKLVKQRHVLSVVEQ